MLTWLLKILKSAILSSVPMSWYRNWKEWMPQPYPQKLLRGIPTADCLDANGWITGQLFRIPDTKNTPQRHDGFDEISINWYDNEKS